MDDWYDKKKWDKQFIKMCKKAEPFLKGFDDPMNPTQLFCDGYHVYIRPNGKGGGIWAMQHFKNDEPGNYDGIFGKDHSEFRVYRADELLNIFKKVGDSSIEWVINRFKEWLATPLFWEITNYTEMYSWDKICLEFVMEKCFGRYWNNKNWIKNPDLEITEYI